MRWGLLYDRRPADASLIATNNREYFDPANIAAPQFSLRRTDVRKLTAFAGGNDHQLEVLGAECVQMLGHMASNI
jgi:hypothetical protein